MAAPTRRSLLIELFGTLANDEQRSLQLIQSILADQQQATERELKQTYGILRVHFVRCITGDASDVLSARLIALCLWYLKSCDDSSVRERMTVGGYFVEWSLYSALTTYVCFWHILGFQKRNRRRRTHARSNQRQRRRWCQIVGDQCCCACATYSTSVLERNPCQR